MGEGLPSGCFWLPHRQPRVEDPGIFPKKTGPGNPLGKNRYFLLTDSFFWPEMLWMTISSIPFLPPQGRPLICTVMSCLKRPVFKNSDLKEKSWSGLAPFPLEWPGQGSDPGTLSSENRSRGRVSPDTGDSFPAGDDPPGIPAGWGVTPC